jgi:hypothetical protein
MTPGAAQAADEPLMLARDGFFYVGGKTMTVDGKEFVYGQIHFTLRLTRRTAPIMFR